LQDSPLEARGRFLSGTGATRGDLQRGQLYAGFESRSPQQWVRELSVLSPSDFDEVRKRWRTGAGRNAHNNNTIFAYAWIMFW